MKAAHLLIQVASLCLVVLGTLYEWKDGNGKIQGISKTRLRDKFIVSFMEQLVPTETVTVFVYSEQTKKNGVEGDAMLARHEGNYMQILQLHSLNETDYQANSELKRLNVIEKARQNFNLAGILLHNKQGENLGKTLKDYLEFAVKKFLSPLPQSILDFDGEPFEGSDGLEIENKQRKEIPKVLTDSLTLLRHSANSIAASIKDQISLENKEQLLSEAINKDRISQAESLKEILTIGKSKPLGDVLTQLVQFLQDYIWQKEMPSVKRQKEKFFIKELVNINHFDVSFELEDLLQVYHRHHQVQNFPISIEEFIEMCYSDKSKMSPQAFVQFVERYLTLKYQIDTRKQLLDLYAERIASGQAQSVCILNDYRFKCVAFFYRLLRNDEMIGSFLDAKVNSELEEFTLNKQEGSQRVVEQKGKSEGEKGQVDLLQQSSRRIRWLGVVSIGIAIAFFSLLFLVPASNSTTNSVII